MTAQRQEARGVTYVSPYFPPDLGGVERVTADLAAHVAARRPVSVLTSRPSTPSADVQSAVPVRRLRAWRVAQVPLMPSLPVAVARLPHEQIVHVHIAQAFVPELVRLGCAWSRRPYVAHFHMDVAPSTRLGFLFDAYKRHVLARTLRAAVAVIVLTDEQRHFLAKSYGVAPERVHVVPNAVATPATTAARSRAGRRPLRLLFVGRLSPQKNIFRLLHAVALTTNEVTLTIVGDGPDRAAAEHTASVLGLDNVTWLGARHGDDVAACYAAADLLVLTSDREGMPMVVLEAMAAGLPVLATDVPGLRPTTGSAARLVAPDAAALAAAIDELSTDRGKLDEMSRRGLDRARRHSWDNVVELIEGVYREVAP